LHATYNESITRDLNVIEAVNREQPLNGLVWFIDHAETISNENLQRIKKLGGGIAIQHRMAYQGEAFLRRYGREAAWDAPPVRQIIDAGVPLALGTDGTRVASYNPWIALYWITTGKTIGGAQVMDPAKTVDRLTALRLITTGGYTLLQQDATKGRLQPGYAADLVILTKDYFTVPAGEIESIQSLLTIVDGKIVYGAGPYQHVAPAALPIIPSWSPVYFYGGYQPR
jgi:predicted amidohydrolase YtcJ